MTDQEMKVEIVKEETIKPSSPTPPHLKTFKLSFLDQIAPPVYNSLILFYKTKYNSYQRSQHLKKSLSEALTRFFQLAGRIDNNNNTIESTDDGARYVEAKFNGLLSAFLDHPNEEVLKRLVPANTESPEVATGPLLLVQATFFDCGGLAIGVCMSHKYADAASLGIFLKSWARGGGIAKERTAFVPQSLTPQDDRLRFPLPTVRTEKPVTKRYVFDKSKITALKAKAANEGVDQRTRVEVVTALVWKCAIKASRLNSESNNSTLQKYSVLSQLVNIRKLVEPPFPEDSVGNLVGSSVGQADYNEAELELQGLVAKVRKGNEEFSEKQAKRLRGDDAVEVITQWSKEVEDLIIKNDVNPFVCASWCDFGFYEVDFGWGKPLWASRPSSSQKNIFTLMDTRVSGGTEVSLTLSEENMDSFERDPELLAFASPI